MKISFISAISIFLLLTSPLFSQEIPDPLIPSKRVTFGNRLHTSRDALFFSEKDSRGNLIILGYTERDFTFSDVQIMSLDSNLELQWSDKLSWDGISYDYPLDLLIDNQDYIWVVSKNHYSNTRANFVITRYSPDGEKLWEYMSPETLDTSTLNMNAYHYFLDEEGYLNFNYLEGENSDYTPTFFRLSPAGEAIDKYQINSPLSDLSNSGKYYYGLSFRFKWPNEVYLMKFNNEEKEEYLLNLTEEQVNHIQSCLYETATTSTIDKKGNLILVGQGFFYNSNQYSHKNSILLSVGPSGEVNYFVDQDPNTDKYLLGFKVRANNELAVVSNVQPIDAEGEPFLNLEIFSEEGELIYSRQSESITGNLVKMEADKILVRKLSGDLAIFDYELNLLSEFQVPAPEQFFVPQDLHQLQESVVLVGTTVADRYPGSDYHSEENYQVRKFENGEVTAKFEFDGEGTSKHYTYGMVRDENGDYLVCTDEFLGPNNLNLGGSKAPRNKKVFRFSKELEYLDEEIVDRDFHLWKEPGYTFKASNGDLYRYEVTEDRKAVNFYLNDEFKWQREAEFRYANNEIAYGNSVDKEGNFVFTSDGRIHKLWPNNDYLFNSTDTRVKSMVILSNNWIFTFNLDYSIRVYSPELVLISEKYKDQNFYLGESTPYLVEKNNKVLLNIRYRNLVFVMDQYGNYEDSFILEGQIHPSVAFFDENDNFNVFHKIGKGLYTEHGHNWSRGAISRYDYIVEDYIGPLPTGDSDQDGVPDLKDQCPDTEPGANVDATGCARLQIPANYFSISTKDETCSGKNNGILTIKAQEIRDFVLELNGESHFFKNLISFQALPPGTYEGCLEVMGEPQTRRCFGFEIKAGQNFDAQAILNKNMGNQQLSIQVLKGTAPYSVKVNGEKIGEYLDDHFDIEAKSGDHLEVASALPCEGKMEMRVMLDDMLQARSNPVGEKAEIQLPYKAQAPVEVKIFNASGQLVHSSLYKTGDSLNLEIDTSTLPPGIYYARISLDKTYSLKLIKR